MNSKLQLLTESCLFCDPSVHKQQNQILLSSDNFYIFAGLGPITEGYLIIASNKCVNSGANWRSISEIPLQYLDELAFIRELVAEFYREIYGHPGLCFEHGRGGGCFKSTSGTKHCHHPHLCCYPGSSSTGTGFGSDNSTEHFIWDMFSLPNQKSLTGLHSIPNTAKHLPYIYIEHVETKTSKGTNSSREITHAQLYLLFDETCLESQFLRRKFSALVGQPDLWDWERFPDFEKVSVTINKFSSWIASKADYYQIQQFDKEPPKISFLRAVQHTTAIGYERVANQFAETWNGVLQYKSLGCFLNALPYKDHHEKEKSPKILDIGCGPGFYTRVFQSIGFDCTAIDNSEEMLEKSRKPLLATNENAVKFIKASIFDLPSELDAAYHGIWCSAVLLHVPRFLLPGILQKIASMLTEKGILYVSFRLYFGSTKKYLPSFDMRPEGRTFFYYTYVELEKAFELSKLEIIDSWEDITEKSSVCNDPVEKPWCHFLLKKTQ